MVGDPTLVTNSDCTGLITSDNNGLITSPVVPGLPWITTLEDIAKYISPNSTSTSASSYIPKHVKEIIDNICICGMPTMPSNETSVNYLWKNMAAFVFEYMRPNPKITIMQSALSAIIERLAAMLKAKTLANEIRILERSI